MYRQVDMPYHGAVEDKWCLDSSLSRLRCKWRIKFIFRNSVSVYGFFSIHPHSLYQLLRHLYETWFMFGLESTESWIHIWLTVLLLLRSFHCPISHLSHSLLATRLYTGFSFTTVLLFLTFSLKYFVQLYFNPATVKMLSNLKVTAIFEHFYNVLSDCVCCFCRFSAAFFNYFIDSGSSSFFSSSATFWFFVG